MLIAGMQGLGAVLTTFDVGSMIAGAFVGVVGMAAAVTYCLSGWIKAEARHAVTTRRLFAAKAYIGYIQADAELGRTRRESWQRHRAKVSAK